MSWSTILSGTTTNESLLVVRATLQVWDYRTRCTVKWSSSHMTHYQIHEYFFNHQELEIAVTALSKYSHFEEFLTITLPEARIKGSSVFEQEIGAIFWHLNCHFLQISWIEYFLKCCWRALCQMMQFLWYMQRYLLKDHMMCKTAHYYNKHKDQMV